MTTPFQSLKATWAIRDMMKAGQLNRDEFCVLLGLLMHADTKGRCDPSYEAIGAAQGRPKSAVTRGFRSLRGRRDLPIGIEVVRRSAGRGLGRCRNLYRLSFAADRHGQLTEAQADHLQPLADAAPDHLQVTEDHYRGSKSPLTDDHPDHQRETSKSDKEVSECVGVVADTDRQPPAATAEPSPTPPPPEAGKEHGRGIAGDKIDTSYSDDPGPGQDDPWVVAVADAIQTIPELHEVVPDARAVARAAYARARDGDRRPGSRGGGGIAPRHPVSWSVEAIRRFAALKVIPARLANDAMSSREVVGGIIRWGGSPKDPGAYRDAPAPVHRPTLTFAPRAPERETQAGAAEALAKLRRERTA